MDTFFDALARFISGAERLGNLSQTAVWAFFSLIFLVYILYDMRQKRISSEQAWSARLEEAEADRLIASAIEKLANSIEELEDQLKELRYKLDKPSGGNNA